MKKTVAFFVSGLIAVTFCAAQTPSSTFRQEGIASWYGIEFEGRPTASGELFDPNLFTAAHPDMPFGTMLIVTNAVNGEKVMVRVNDRGPFVKSRIIDVSRAAAEKLNMLETGTAQVVIELAPSNASTMEVVFNTDSSAPEVYDVADLAQADDTTILANPLPSNTVQQPQTTNIAVPPPYTPRQPVVVQNPPNPQGTRQSATTPQTTSQPGPIARTGGQQVPQQNTVTAPATPQTGRQPVPATPQTGRQPVPATPQTSRQPGSPLPNSFQPIPTTARPPAPPPTSTPVMPPTTASTPSSPNPQPPRNYTRYAQANILGGPVVNGKYYRLQVGSFRVAKNAVDVFDRLSVAGFNPQWEPFENLYRIVLSNIRGEDVNSIAVRLGDVGFKDIIIREEH
jgi:rare lipoprotein A